MDPNGNQMTKIPLTPRRGSGDTAGAQPRRQSPWSLNRSEISALVASEPAYRADQLWEGLYLHGKPPDELSNLPKKLRQRLANDLEPRLVQSACRLSKDAQTTKWLWTLPDGATIESVLMRYERRNTVCLSSQAGCAMACGFCATGQAGYKRNLQVGEILEQVAVAVRSVAPGRLSNVVFMGMGEPLANYDRVIEAANRIINDFGIGARKLTISTIGLVPQIKRLAREQTQIGLAVSLHAANNDLRDKLIPINRRHPIEDLVDACVYFREQTGRRVSFEWAMIEGVNDSETDAKELIRLARRAKAHVNLIPLNPTPGWPTKGSSNSTISAFARLVESASVPVTIRDNRGTDIDAACGQLSATASR